MRRFIGLAAMALAAWTASATAQNYPTKPITVIVPFAAGGPTDVLTRLVGDHMSRTLGQQIVVENVSGAGGTVGSTKAFRSDPDGYTLIVGNVGSHAASQTLYKNLRYDPREFEPVGMVAGTPMYVAVRKEFPAKTFQEFLDHVKKNPGKVTNAHAGVGSTSHLVCLFLSNLTGINMQPVPYRGTGPAMNDLVAGQVDSTCDQAPTVVPQAQGNAIRALVIAEPERSKATPDVPTSAEAGLPEFRATGWNAMFAPKGTPKPIVDKLSQALNAALNEESVKKRIDELGSIPPKPEEANPQWLGQFVKSEVDKWGKVIQAAGVTGQ